MKLKTLLLILAFLVAWKIVYGEEIDIGRIITIESGGNHNAYNEKSGCIGLMGINPKGALADWNKHQKDYCIEASDGLCFYQFCTIGDLYNPSKNVLIGTWYINERIPQMLKAYGIEDTVENRLISYNFGIGNLKKYLKGEKKLPRETRRYYEKYKRLNK